jgi:hypothetical protein
MSHPLLSEYEQLVTSNGKTEEIHTNGMLRESVILEDHFDVGEEVVVDGKQAKVSDIVRDGDGDEVYVVKMEDGSEKEVKPSQIKKEISEECSSDEEECEDKKKEEKEDEVSETQELSESVKTKSKLKKSFMKKKTNSKPVTESRSKFDEIFNSIIKENFDEEENDFDSDMEEFDSEMEETPDELEDSEMEDDFEDEETEEFDPVSAISQIKDLISQIESHYGIGEEGEEELEIGDEEIEDVEDLDDEMGDDGEFDLKDEEDEELRFESAEVGEGAGGKATDVSKKQQMTIKKDSTKNSVKRPSKTHDHRKDIDKGKKSSKYKSLKKSQNVKGFEKPKYDKK